MTSEQVIPPIMALRSCVTRERLLVLNEIGSRIGNWGRGDDLKKETNARGGIRVPDSGRLEDDMVVVRKQRSSDKRT